MGLEWIGDVGPFAVMVLVIVANVSNMVVVKAAMSQGMDKFVIVVYSSDLASLLCFFGSIIFHRSASSRPPLTFNVLCGFILIAVLGFFKQYLVLLLVNQMASALFRFIGAIGRTMTVAGTFGAFVLLLLFALGGVVLSRDDVKKWWIWGYWVSPLMYGQNAIVVNEFLGKSWSHVLPRSNVTLGVAVLKSRGFLGESEIPG